MIQLKYGRIIIPNTLVTNIVKFKLPALKWAGHRKDYWYVYASVGAIEIVKELFQVDLKKEHDSFIDSNFIIYKTKPYSHQIEGLIKGYKREGYGYLCDPGLGKTKMIIDEAQTHNFHGDITGVLIICPKSMISTWINQIEEHGYSEEWKIQGWQYKDKIPLNNKLSWFIINIDALNTKTGYSAAYDFILTHETLMVIDESTAIKNSDALRTKAVMNIRMQAKYRRILTGTIIANTPMDIYAQLYFLDPEIVYGWSFTTFKRHFCILGGYKNKQVFGYIRQDELADMIANTCFKASKEECLDLPSKIYQQRYIPMSKGSRDIYTKIVNQILVDLSAIADQPSTVVTNLAITKMIKLRQFTGGMILDQDGNQVIINNDKLNELSLLLDEGVKKCIIWYQFKHERLSIENLLKTKYITFTSLHGSLNTNDREKAIRDFEIDKVTSILVQNDTGSEGITLNAANTVIYYTNTLSHKTRLQSEDRCHRIGQTKSITYIDLLIEKSIDITIYKMLQAKKELADLILNNVTKIQNLMKGDVKWF